jgi:hypothetical protein
MTRFQTNRSTNRPAAGARRAVAEADTSPPAALLELRLRLLEEAYRELGARLAALEGIVFSRQHSLKEIAPPGPEADPPRPLDPPLRNLHPPHRPASPK